MVDDITVLPGPWCDVTATEGEQIYEEKDDLLPSLELVAVDTEDADADADASKNFIEVAVDVDARCNEIEDLSPPMVHVNITDKDVSKMKVAELKLELRKRVEKTKGNKGELVGRSRGSLKD